LPGEVQDLYLADGAVSSNTPVRIAVALAPALIVLPTGHACAPHEPRKARSPARCTP